ncbi:hypothetical protein CEXT_414731 [Caerostris extrusa]|uniref:Uncharacterized protein n=1 Tax=Caerostris extrusa TaxID=172846 RepID=A0AAV4QT92_CAEEX|nr:hypothetical protein CEXT_414731 [Caerostris extrusa]
MFQSLLFAKASFEVTTVKRQLSTQKKMIPLMGMLDHLDATGDHNMEMTTRVCFVLFADGNCVCLLRKK